MNQAHITSVAECIKKGEKTRADLKRECNIPYDTIAMVLYELVDIQNVVEYTEDGLGIQRFSWVGGDESQSKHAVSEDSAQDDVYDDRVTATSLGIKVAEEVQKYVHEWDFNFEFDSQMIRSHLLNKYPQLETLSEPLNLGASISQQLVTLCARNKITLMVKSKGKLPSKFAKSKSNEEDSSAVESSVEKLQDDADLDFRVSTASDGENSLERLQTAETSDIVGVIASPKCHSVKWNVKREKVRKK